jgi:hypothetical protein
MSSPVVPATLSLRLAERDLEMLGGTPTGHLLVLHCFDGLQHNHRLVFGAIVSFPVPARLPGPALP